jgi:predicted amidohydrolase
MVREAARNGADVVVTPEGVLEGYVINEVNAVKGLEERSQIEQKFLELGEPLDGSYVRKACDLADETDVFLVLGFLERSGNQLYNTAILIDPDGDIVGRYSKTHFAQGYAVNPEFYDPGEQYPVFQTPFGKVGMLICYDRQLPEPARILALKGAQVLFVPSYGSYTDENGWNTILMRTRAYENGFPVVFSHPFQSLLINRKGSLLAVGSANELVYYEIDTAPERYQDRFSNRRPETYGKILE